MTGGCAHLLDACLNPRWVLLGLVLTRAFTVVGEVVDKGLKTLQVADRAPPDRVEDTGRRKSKEEQVGEKKGVQ